MVVFPNAKINIGLFVTEKRPDGFHNLETVFYPVSWADILEVNPAPEAKEGVCLWTNTGLPVDCPQEKNLVVRAYRLLDADYHLPAVRVHLHKLIPFGAGLGGGSSDAAFMLKALNTLFQLELSGEQLEEYAARLGSDCAFFIENRPAFASGKGECLEKIPLSLEDYRLVLVKPAGGVSTAEAYAGICPRPAPFDLRQLPCLPVTAWKERIENDFEQTVFKKFPEIAMLKAKLYEKGASYAAMTGSGSAVFGLFPVDQELLPDFPGCFVWQSQYQKQD